ncbi:DMT family transporter [Subtercola sp. YIM 133946]|uniref:DMT family transporter n=1 Tax=Subtercola sp. YIM 133946 TaxID=3118909 RepID=UPI002F91EC69
MAVDLIALSPTQSLGVPIALIGAVFLAFGAEYQHRGVNKVDAASENNAKSGLNIGQLVALVKRPSWLLGTCLIVLAIICQLTSLYLAPLTVVQPLGAIALVITAILNARSTKMKLTAASIRAIAFCVLGIAIFVTIASLTTSTVPIGNEQLVVVLIVLAVVLALLLVGFILFRHRSRGIFYIFGGGILFGFVATLAKLIIERVTSIIEDGFRLVPGDGLTIVCLLGIIVAGLLGTYFVQTAYSTGPPDLVVAGLTVIDPIVGVTIGIVVLGEASSAPWWAAVAFVLAGILAVYGVTQLARRAPVVVPDEHAPHDAPVTD